jgi:ATP-binding cassette subfamily F protein uup
MAAAILSYEGLGLRQGGGWLFKDLDLHIGARDRLALIGRNGAGKTTLLKCVAGRSTRTSGGVRSCRARASCCWNRTPIWRRSPRFATMRCQGDDAPASHEVDAIADQIGIDLDCPAATASGGERRRAAIARALAMDPGRAAAGRADQPSRPRRDRVAGGLAGRFRRVHRDQPRPDVSWKRPDEFVLWLDRGTIRGRDRVRRVRGVDRNRTRRKKRARRRRWTPSSDRAALAGSAG